MTQDLKKIVIVSPKFLPSMGGVENYTHQLATSLTKLGNRVMVITNEAAEDYIDSSLQYRVVRIPSYSFANGRFPISKLFWGWRRIARILLEFSTDYCLIQTRYYLLGRSAAFAAANLNIPSIVLDHSSSYISQGNGIFDNLLKVYERHLTADLKRAEVAFYGVSSASSEWLNEFGIRSEGELHNAIDVETFVGNASELFELESLGFIRSDDSVTNVVFAGRLIQEKGVLQYIEAARSLLCAGIAVRFYIAGSGPLENEISGYASRHEGIVFLGRLSRTQMARLLLESDIFCLPTLYPEGLPSVLLEAAACSCALISTETGGTKELIPNENQGIVLTDEKEFLSNDLAIAIKSLISNPKRLKLLQNRAHSLVSSKYSWIQTAQAFLFACDSHRS